MRLRREHGFVRKWVARFFGCSSPPLPLAGVSAPDWSQDHMRAWRGFMAGPAGQALWARLITHNYLVAMNAIKKNDLHACGVATGFAECVGYLESLSRTSCVTEDSDEQSALGEPTLLERISP